jgi:hypothetical protein
VASRLVRQQRIVVGYPESLPPMFGSARYNCRTASYSRHARTYIPCARETNKVGRTWGRTVGPVALDAQNSIAGKMRSSECPPCALIRHQEKPFCLDRQSWTVGLFRKISCPFIPVQIINASRHSAEPPMPKANGPGEPGPFDAARFDYRATFTATFACAAWPCFLP